MPKQDTSNQDGHKFDGHKFDSPMSDSPMSDSNGIARHSIDVTELPEQTDPTRPSQKPSQKPSEKQGAGAPDTPRRTPAPERNDSSLPVVWLIIIIMGLLLINGFLFLQGFFSNLLTG